MTEQASKYGLRKAAEERRNRHAQRTPLPPRKGQIQDAKDAIKEAAQMKFAVEPLTKKGRLQPAAKSEVVKLAKEGKKAKKAKAKAKAKDAAEAPRIPSQAKPPAIETTGATETHHPKATAFSVDARAFGWTVSIKTTGNATSVSEVTAERGDERIVIEWQNGAQVTQPTYWRPDGTTSKLRNASAARKQMQSAPPSAEELAARSQRVARIIGKKAERVRRPLAHDYEALLDDDLIAAVQGRKLVWINSISQGEETARVSKGGKVSIREDASGRSITFTTDQGFRTVRLSSLVAVN